MEVTLRATFLSKHVYDCLREKKKHENTTEHKRYQVPVR